MVSTGRPTVRKRKPASQSAAIDRSTTVGKGSWAVPLKLRLQMQSRTSIYLF